MKNWLRDALGLGESEAAFPWQENLLKKFMTPEIPSSLDIPTGLGKTSVMAVWLVARACGAQLPRRLVYIVDRRAVVDQATTEAERLKEWVEKNGEVKKKLGLERSLAISTLRGQYVDNREWLEDPAFPAIIVGTVDMVGSRLLFEGYGVSRKMRPYHAGLLGTDTLVVLDESHLVPPFQKLLEIISQGQEFKSRTQGLVPKFKVLSLSATGQGPGGDSFTLGDEDKEHPVVKKRLEASKKLELFEIAAPGEGGDLSELPQVLSEKAWELRGDNGNGVRVLVFCDQRKHAAKAKKRLEELAQKASVDIKTELFVGGRRVFERQQAQARLRDLGFIAGNRLESAKSTFLFATSAAEVGVDLDADHMVCDLVAWERMVQRLGRVNRRGEGRAKIIVVCEPQPEDPKQKAKEKDEKYKERLEEWRKKWEFAHSCKSAVEKLKNDASPGAILKLKEAAKNDMKLQKMLIAATTPAPLRPALNRALVDAWSMTSLKQHTGRPEIGPWLRGWIPGDPPQTAVLWRTHLPVREGAGPKKIEAFFEAAPPHASELLEIETYRAADWLKKRIQKLLETEGEKSALLVYVLGQDGAYKSSLRLEEMNSMESDELKQKLVNAVLVVDARMAGLKDGLLDDGEETLPRSLDDGQAWLDEMEYRVRRIEGEDGEAADDWRENFRFTLQGQEDEAGDSVWLVVEKRHGSTNEDDRATSTPQLLTEHQCQVEQKARGLAAHLGLPSNYTNMLAIAGRLHDEGKKAKRWQRAFNAPAGAVYGKTAGPIQYSLLDGYRHEFGSLPYAEQDEEFKKLGKEEQDLALHLIASHHGFARPVIGTEGCEDAPPSALEARADKVALRFACLQETWGPWGLAWWETLMRAADQQASREHEDKNRKREKP